MHPLMITMSDINYDILFITFYAVLISYHTTTTYSERVYFFS